MKHSFIKSVQCSMNGLLHAFKTERNFKIQIICGICILLLGWVTKLSRMEWTILFLTMGFVLSMELINTCIEKIMDMVHPTYSEKVKIIKDMAAGAVWVSSLTALVIGIFLFYRLFI